MRVLVLGSGAGGGLPQWNAFNLNGRAAFGRDPLVSYRTQCSIAVSVDGEHWALINASPDLRQQIISNPQLHPRQAPRHSPIGAVLLTGAEIDQVTGLLTMRERQRFTLFGSGATLEALGMNPIFAALGTEFVARVAVVPDAVFEPLPGLRVRAIDVPGKAPLYLEAVRTNPTESRAGDSLAFEVEGLGKRMVFAPGVATMTEALDTACNAADLVLVDGTLYADDEMIAAGEGIKAGRRMGHMSMSGPDGMMKAFEALAPKRRMFIHINNTNPAARADSDERKALTVAGWSLAEDGMEIVL